MANIFGRVSQRLRSLFGKTPEEVERVRIEAIRERRRAEDQVAALGKLTAEARAKAAFAARAKQNAEVEKQRQRLIALSRQERLAKENADAARRKEEAAKQALIRLEQTKTMARRALLLGRKDADEELFERTFGYAKPKGAKEYKNLKEAEGGLPDVAMFLRGYKYEAFASSNVKALVYDPTQSDLYICYIKSGRWYRYMGVSKAMASEAYQAASKGIWVFDRIRVRGDNPRDKSPPARTRIPFQRDKQPPAYLPIDEQSSSAAAFASGGGF